MTTLKRCLILMCDNRLPEAVPVNFWSYTTYINKQYATKFNYDFKYITPYYKYNTGSLYTCIDTHTGAMRHAAWSKLIAVQAYLPEYEYVVYIDTDCCFIRFDISIEDILQRYETENTILFQTANPWHPHMPCSGFFICKNTPIIMTQLRTWYTYPVPINDSQEWKQTLTVAAKSSNYKWTPNTHWEQDVLWTLIATQQLHIRLMTDEIALIEHPNQYLRHIVYIQHAERNPYFLAVATEIQKRTGVSLESNCQLIEIVPLDTSQYYTMANILDSIWKTVQPYTYLGKERIANNIQCINEVIDKGIQGDIIEIGVYKGGSIMSMLLALNQRSAIRPVRLYDTFSGMTAPSDCDVEANSGKHYNDCVVRTPEFKCLADLQYVQKNVSMIPYPSDMLHYHIGDIMKTTTFPSQIALLRLDTDFYDSTKFELEHFYPLVSQGGIVVVDDYGHWKGARKAVDEFLTDKPHIKLISIDYTGVYFYKS